MNEIVVHSMELIQMPAYLLSLLGVLKISGIIALWFSPFKWIKEWAYAGFTFDFIGAIFGFFATGNLVMPDILMAPVGLGLCLFTPDFAIAIPILNFLNTLPIFFVIE